MFAPLVPHTSVAFVSQASIDNGAVASYGLRKRVEPVKNCRAIGKKDMKFNDVMPRMRVGAIRLSPRQRRRCAMAHCSMLRRACRVAGWSSLCRLRCRGRRAMSHCRMLS